MSQRCDFLVYYASIGIDTEISLEIETKYDIVSGSNAFNPKVKFEGKVSKRHSYFLGPSKKVGPKMIHFYCMKAYPKYQRVISVRITTPKWLRSIALLNDYDSNNTRNPLLNGHDRFL